MPKEYRERIIPIIAPTASRAVSLTESARIGVLSTAATHKSGAFAKEIKKLMPSAEVTSVPAPELVLLAESGEFGESLSDAGLLTLKRSLRPLFFAGVDTVILGCTHFAYFEREIEEILSARAVNSAKEGALALIDRLKRHNEDER